MTELPQPLEDFEEMETPSTGTHTQRNRWWLIGALLLLCAGIGYRRYAIAHGNQAPLFSQPVGQGTKTITVTPSPTPEPGLTVLLMGRGGAGHDGGALADTIVLARILESQKRIVLLSLPRDLWVNVPYNNADGIMGKINSAYAIGIDSRKFKDKSDEYTGVNGGGKLAGEVVSKVTGLTIDKYVTVDFSGFESAVNSIGGVDLTVDKAFTDYEYPIAGREDVDCTTYTPVAVPNPDATQPNSEADLIAAGKLDANLLSDLPKEFPCRYELVHFDSGKQHMNGTVALKYVRSRHSNEDGNDFSRSRRQKIMLEAVADRLFSINAVTKIPTFFSTLRSHLDTDLSTGDIIGLLPKAQEYRGYKITNLTLSTDNYLGQGYTADGQFELFPLTGVGAYDPIKQWVARTIDPKLLNTTPLIEVDGNWRNSSASATLKDMLNAQGLPAKAGQLIMKNATTSATLIIQSANIDPKVVSKIKETANIKDEYVMSKIASSSSQSIDLKILLP